MSRSALWRQEANIKERERQSKEIFDVVLEEGRSRPAKGQIQMYGNDTTFNMNNMIISNISSCAYFVNKCCAELHDWNSVVDEIYYEVKHMEPWTIGASKIPSTSFCLLVRLFTLRVTEKQMWSMLQHPDSPYIRCVGFLYLRFVADPTTLYTKWFQPFIYDTESVQIEASSKKSNLKTVGEYVRFLLTNMNYFSTLLPRLPVSIQRDVQVKLVLEEEIYNRAKSHISSSKKIEYFKTIGSSVQALYADDDNPITWYDAVIDRILLPNKKSNEEGIAGSTSYDSDYPKFIVTFPEYGNTETVALGELDMPHTNNTTASLMSASNSSSTQHHHSYHQNDQYDNRSYDNHHYQQDNIMDRIRKKERDGVTTSKKGEYAKRPMTYKGSLATSSSSSSSATRDNRTYASHMNNKRLSLNMNNVPHHSDCNNAATTNDTKQNYHDAREKRQKLLDKYG